MADDVPVVTPSRGPTFTQLPAVRISVALPPEETHVTVGVDTLLKICRKIQRGRTPWRWLSNVAYALLGGALSTAPQAWTDFHKSPVELTASLFIFIVTAAGTIGLGIAASQAGTNEEAALDDAVTDIHEIVTKAVPGTVLEVPNARRGLVAILLPWRR